MSEYPRDLRDCEVVSVQVTGPHRVRVTHRDGTSAVHIFKPGDFGRADFVALDDPTVFATAQVIDGTLAWDLGGGLIYDVAPDGLWAHARGWCPDGSHDLAAKVEVSDVEARIAATPGLAAQLDDANRRHSSEFRPRAEGRPPRRR
ncbi:DUF2442 domain-containing protein [Tsukamurella pulmonis]|uniref:DUF2442 domain-containing protein n=1 Tax=Tsukamurella pulmonis TaxID=47312 RepID=UPI000E09D4F7|nr:DUF2442 domain-containing protein [Tsukamurella pulmonis]RDH13748.1 DUF2442 domain-containing protein [Tsukamurella pulmonis]